MTKGLSNIKDRSELPAQKQGDTDILVFRQEAKMQSKTVRETLKFTRTVDLQTSSMESMLAVVQDSQVAMENTVKCLLGKAKEMKKRNELLERRLSAVTPKPTLSITLTQSLGA